MNGWDLFSWIMAGALAVVALAVFVRFLVDARRILRDLDDEPPAD